MIIVEGADLVGKTYFVKWLVRGLRRRGHNYASCHLGLLTDGDRFDEYLGLVRLRQVWDRFHLSEVIYRKHDDREPRITPEKFAALDATLRQRYGAFVVVLTAPATLIEKRFSAIGDEVYDLDHILQVNSSFVSAATNGYVHCRSERFEIDHDYHAANGVTDERDVDTVIDQYLAKRPSETIDAKLGPWAAAEELVQWIDFANQPQARRLVDAYRRLSDDETRAKDGDVHEVRPRLSEPFDV